VKLADLRMALVQRAVGIYLDLAYGGAGGPRRMPNLALPDDAGADRILELFQKEVVVDGANERRQRYALRLGNRNYPFMKLVLQEHLLDGEFIFAVDTHDEMAIKPDFPDYEAWMAVRRFNRKLKADIETQLASEGLATAAALRTVVSERAPRGSKGLGHTILVVDDEEPLADCVESLLAARGFVVAKVHDGRAALAAAARLRPDLIVLDYELPEMDGLEVIAALQATPATRGIPVLLTTASKIDVADVEKAQGFLAKPYGEELLYAMVQRLLPQPNPRP
jgi:two-component system phosphate regulon response regulator PhoB